MSRIGVNPLLPTSLDFLLGKCFESFAKVDDNVRRFEQEHNFELVYRRQNNEMDNNSNRYNGILIKDYNTNNQNYYNKEQQFKDSSNVSQHYSMNYHSTNMDMTYIHIQRKNNKNITDNDKHSNYSRNNVNLNPRSTSMKKKESNRHIVSLTKTPCNSLLIPSSCHKEKYRNANMNNKEMNRQKKKNMKFSQSKSQRDNEEINTFDLSRFCTFAPNSSEESTKRTNKKRKIATMMIKDNIGKNKAKVNSHEIIKAKLKLGKRNNNNKLYYYTGNRIPFINDYVNYMRQYRNNSQSKSKSKSNSNSRYIGNESVSLNNISSKDCLNRNKSNNHNAINRSKSIISITKNHSLLNLKEYLTNKREL